MKQWLCRNCGRRGETDDNIVFKVCNACQEEMIWNEAFDYGKREGK